MLHEFLTNNRDELTQRCQRKVASRPGRAATEPQLQNGIPMFLDQLIRTLQVEQTATPMESRKISGPSGGGATLSEVSVSAAEHGRDLLLLNFSVDQVVHDYGDLCQAITDLAFERDAPFSVDEFRTLNRCLDNAIADAVTEFSYQRDFNVVDKHRAEANERLGMFVHELRNFLNTATLSFVAAKTGNLNLSGATGAVLERSLAGLDLLIDRSVDDIRTNANPVIPEIFSLTDFIEEVKSAGELAAEVRGCLFTVSPVDPALAIHGSREMLFSALWNLLQNAFKFTHAHTEVTLNAYAVADNILIDVKDHCGGLPPGAAEKMFLPFMQHDTDKTGLGLGLSIAKQYVMSNGGILGVHNIPGVGCTFTISVPRHSL